MILIIDDDIAVRASLALLLKTHKYSVREAAGPAEALLVMDKTVPDLVLLDLNFSMGTTGEEGLELLAVLRARFPDVPVILITGWGSIALAVRGMKLGAGDFIHKPWDNEHLLASIKTLLDLRGPRPGRRTRQQLDAQFHFQHIIGEDPRILQILDTIGRVAPTEASVLITGESGTGKELIAEAIHQNSLRSSKPFVKVNLGGISTSLFESEMFGHIRGAFTDARFDRAGRFETAHKGTIFLDEIGDLDAGSQVKLLRVLQDRTYEVLGSSRTKTVDVRVVCATNKDLADMVARGAFREDLLYRINLITLHLPPLRERPKDIPLLVNFFIGNLREIYNRPSLSVSAAAMRWLQHLPLPGNIRQLKNLVERTILVSASEELRVEDFMAQLERSPTSPAGPFQTLEAMEVEMIKRALEFHKHKIARAAKALGITRSALYRRLDKYQIPYDASED
ncbi:sigma-54-dependent transcriptional regulator [Dinghuibacter silviterrae]|uniref:DNA-binding NtrC family response regulator n=1 Tax=Dinghuibacter silviterrae TaxID=1539049 RepID=A0A4R8DQW6_9BACT|nr:sigma-54 dependent transcriptional regulator [Dinghuibacter silviterrae]TDX00552.1 DNA-binding NtrC family response regulator [Dinghuibacter silviterrae]